MSIHIGPRPYVPLRARPQGATRFAIVAHARTGSNFLCGALNSHPSVLCHHELFNPTAIDYALGYRDGQLASLGTRSDRDGDPLAFLERVYANDLAHAAVGFKLMPRQPRELVDAVLADRRVRKIVLRRDNRVRVFVSRLRAAEIGVYTHERYDGLSVHVDPAALLEFAARYDAYYADAEAALGGQPAVRLSYERLHEPGVLAGVLDFLGVDGDESLLRGSHAPQSSDSLREAIANYDELVSELRGTDLHDEVVSDESRTRPRAAAAPRPPDFVGVGAQKAGTTWWHSLIAAHPQVWSPPGFLKEGRFFSPAEWDSERFDEEGFYATFARPDGTIAGEWTPDYLWHSDTAELLHRFAPDARLLFLVRDPVERYRSGIAHHLMYDEPIVRRTFRKTYRAGLYGLQLQRLLRFFPREQVLVLQYEQCRLDPAGELARTYRFLGLDDSFVPADLERPVHGTTVERPELPPRFRARLVRGYARDAERLAKLAPEVDLALWPSLSQDAPARPRLAIVAPTREPELVTAAPDFVGIGAMKAGTTRWFKLVGEHPEIHCPDPWRKELHFFDDRPEGFDVRDYHALFPRPEGLLAGEWTPSYMFLEHVPAMLAQAAPEAKLLAILRDPVERYRSGITHSANRWQSLNDGWLRMHREIGFYARQLRRVFDHFPREQVLVLQYERCVLDPRGQLERTFRFLGLRDTRFPPADPAEVVHRTEVAKLPLPESARRALTEAYRDDVLELRRLVPDLDLSLWPSYARVEAQAA